MKQHPHFPLLLALKDWWPIALASIPVLLGIWAAIRNWMESELRRVRTENRELKKDNTRLTREAIIRIEDLKVCYRQIELLQQAALDARSRAQALLELKDESTK